MKFTNVVPKYLIVAASSWVSRGISAIVQIMSVRYLVDILGQDKYAVFILLSGLIAWCNLTDFGIGNSLLAFVSEKRAENKKYNHLIFSAFIVLSFFFLILLIVLYFIAYGIAEIYLKNFSSLVIGNKVVAFYVASLIFCVTTIGGVVYKIWYAEQVGWLSNLYPALGATMGLLGIYLISKQSFIGSYDVLDVFCVFFVPTAIITTILLIWKITKFGKINISLQYNLKIIQILLNRAKPFLLFSIMGVIVLQTDYIVLSQKISSQDIVLYAVLMKIFLVIYFVYSSILQAWWPVCTELRIQKKWTELKNEIAFIVIIGAFAMIVLGGGVYILQGFIFEILNIKNVYHVSFSLFLLFIIYFIIRVWCDVYALLFQTMNYMKPLFMIVPIQLVINFALQWFLAERWGLYGILMGLILSFLLTVAIFLPWSFNKQIKIESSIE